MGRPRPSVFRSRLFWKLYAGFVIVIVMTAVVVGGLIAGEVEGKRREILVQNLEDQCRWMTRGLVSAISTTDPDRARILAALEWFRSTSLVDARFEVFSHAGEPIVSSPGGEVPSSAFPDVFDPRTFDVRERPNESGDRELVLVREIRRGAELAGYLRATVRADSVVSDVGNLYGDVAIGAGIAAAAGLLLGFLLARRLTAPIASMTAVAEEMAAGNYRQRVPAGATDEVGILARAFNTMARQLHDRMETVTRENDKLNAVLEGMVEGVVAVDADERIIHLNEAAQRILELDDQSLGEPIWQETRIADIAGVIRAALEDNRVHKRESRFFLRRGECALELHAAPLSDRDGHRVGVVVVLHDVTELRRLETLREEFVANVSHELKTPITAIRGFLESVIEDPAMSTRYRTRFLGRARDQSVRLSDLVADLLSLARLESDENRFEFVPKDLTILAEELVEESEAMAKQRSVELRIELSPEPVVVLGEGEGLRQIIGNLLSNALRYTRSGGRVWLRVYRDANQGVVEVEDTGVGISPSDQRRIFERFYRVDRARSREVGGTGLGLSIVKHLCRVHRGRVSVTSEVGRGSTFRVTLPLFEPALASP